MNSRSDGRINSTISPRFGDFGFLQTWQITGAVGVFVIETSPLN
jgi:hypothetical protein